ncbi:MAG: ATP-binding protein [Calditrichota bacterium]
MITSKITIDFHSEIILEADEIFQTWMGKKLDTDDNLTDFFESVGDNSLEDGIHQAISTGTLRYMQLRPLRTVEGVHGVMVFLDPVRNLFGNKLTLRLYPLGDQFHWAHSDRELPNELFDSINDFIFVCSPDYTILKANFSSHTVYGGQEEIEGRKCYEVLHGKTNPCEECPLPQTLSSKKVIPYEYYERNFGEFLETRTYPQVDSLDRFRGFTMINRIVSTRHKQEMEATQNKKLQALSQMASGISHDFNNMLTIILGRVQLLRQKVSEPGVLASLKTIEKAAMDSTEMIQRLQDFTRKREQLAEQAYGSVLLNDLAEDVVEYVRTRIDRTMRQRGIHIEIETRLGKIPHVEANKTALRNVLLNLIFNAVDALDVGGLVTVWTECDGEVVNLGVTDTGVGMSKEVVEKIFDPFFSTKSQKGSGLGLSEVYGVVNQHNASIEVDSKLGEGSTFVIHFPVPVSTAIPKLIHSV